jgi:hypothetical protein
MEKRISNIVREGNILETDNLEDLGVDRRIILR